MMTRFRGDTEVWNVFRTPSANDMTRRKTVTTSATPRTVMPVETFRTQRFRRLYLKGIRISHHLPQTVHYRYPRGSDGGDEAGQGSNQDGGGHREEDGERSDPEVVGEHRDGGALHRLDQERGERIGEEHAGNP